MIPKDPALMYTSPENRAKCGFCKKDEEGYAKKDTNGIWRASCWKCVRPASASAPQPKRHMIRALPTNAVIVTGDPDEAPTLRSGKAPGLAHSNQRPKVK